MHEMSLAIRIVELVSASACAAKAERINEVEIEVGALAGVMTEALSFCFEAAAHGTLVAGARLIIRERGGLAHCPACVLDFPVESLPVQCPKCGEYGAELIQGRELGVLSLVVDENE